MEFTKEQAAKQRIKDLSIAQRIIKGQRKTVKLEGERIVPPSVAASKHAFNRWVLRRAYIGYAILRGKDPKVADQNVTPELIIQAMRIMEDFTAVAA